MKMLLIHAKEFGYRVKEKAIKEAEEIDKNKESLEVENALVAYITVEEKDSRNIEAVSINAVNIILEQLNKVKATCVVIYPYAHLSSELASSNIAIATLKQIEELLKEKGVTTYRAPFGWYKEFVIKCYGHPLAESLREVEPEKVSKREEKTKKKENYAILTPDGSLYSPDVYEFKPEEKDFKTLVEREVFKTPAKGGRPKFLDYCKKFGIEWEPLSDLGHMRYSPEGAIIIDSIAEYSWKCVNDLGIPILRVKGTNMFDLSVPAVKQHAELYGDRLYEVRVGSKRFVLRYAACHQQFAMMKDWIISYRHLPLGVFEVADSYRLEQPGELLLCFRLRKFLMPDLHILCKDLEEAKKVAIKVHRKIYEEIKKIGRDYVSIYNLTKSFLEKHKDFVLELVKIEGKPVLLHFVEEGKYYWVLNIEYNIIDELERPREIGTFQIDVGNAQRFNIVYLDEKGEKKYPVIIHTALIGSVERYLYVLFDNACRMEKEGKLPRLPTWVSPVQVRLIPVKKEHLDFAIKIANELESIGVRVDIDDRDESVAKRIRDAEVKWVPYVIVVGDKEVKSGRLSVRIRENRITREYSVDEFKRILESELKDYPKVPLYMPKFVSMRPIY